jgi:hypothetical protein
MHRLSPSNDELPTTQWRLQNFIAGPLRPLFPGRDLGPRFSSSVTIRTRRDIRHSVHVIETHEEWFRIQDSFLADAREVPMLSVDVLSHFTPRGTPGRSDSSLTDSTVLDYYDRPAAGRPSSPASDADPLADSPAPVPNITRHLRFPLVVIKPIYPRSVPDPFWEAPSSSDGEHSVRSLSDGGPDTESFPMARLLPPSAATSSGPLLPFS